MATRSKNKWTLDSQGQYPRQIGWKLKDQERYVQHKFRLGSDLKEAQRREQRLQELWHDIEKTHIGEGRPVWNSLTLSIAKEIAKGNVQIVVSRQNNSPEAYARYLHRLQRHYPMVSFVAEDEAAFVYGSQANHDFVQAKVDEIRKVHLRNGNVAELAIGAAGPSLHQALNEYAAQIRRTKIDVAFPKPFGRTQLNNIERLKDRHRDVPLDTIKFDAIQAMIDFWRGRPKVKGRGTPCRKKTVEHHIQEMMRFFKWLHRSDRFNWRKPEDFDELETKVDETPAEVQARATPTQVKTYDIDQLKTLYEYATPLERILMLLGVNCGFGAAEIGSLTLGQVLLSQPHPHAQELGFDTQPTDSFIKRIRHKSMVYGEHILWSHTIKGLRWMIERRQEQGNATPDSVLFMTDKGLPCLKLTKSGHNGQWFANRWADLTRRVQKDHPKFPSLSFGKLRKTGGNLMRQIGGGEVSGVFLCHGRPVKSDDLSEVYTNRIFGDVFRGLRVVEQRLSPMFAAVDEPFGKYHQQYTSRKVARRILDLHQQGRSVREIASEAGVSRTTVHRHIKRSEDRTSEKGGQ